MKIKELKADDRPRERMMKQGVRSLGTAELLAVILRTGSGGKNAVETAQLLISNTDGSLARLAQMSPQALCRTPGIGMGKALAIIAAVELGRRLNVERTASRIPTISSPEDAYEALAECYTTDANEECWALLLKRSRRLITAVKISEGGASLTEINIKKIVRSAIDAGASSLIISHNHPSGDPRPSLEDIRTTEKLRQALSVFELALVDHVILGEDSIYSFSEESEIQI